MTTPSLLFVSHHLPIPPDSGGKLRTYYTAKALAVDYRLSMVALADPGRVEKAGTGQDPDDLLADLDELRVVRRDSPFPSRRTWATHLVSVFTGRPYTDHAYDPVQLGREIQGATRGLRVDLIHVDTYHLHRVFRYLPRAPLACTYHDLHSEILSRRSETETSWWTSRYCSLQARRLERLERRCAGLVDLNVVVSERDRETLKRQLPECRVEVVPNGLPLGRFEQFRDRKGGGDNRTLVFVGPGSWYPNRDAMRFFAEQILPLIVEARGSVTLKWVGEVGEEIRREFGSVKELELTGRVDDVRPYVAEADCVVVPLRSGGGTRLKILEAWAMRKAVVSTSVGCEGLRPRDGRNLLVRDAPREFANAVARVLAEPDLRTSLGEGGYETVRRHYDWDEIGRHLRALYAELVQGRIG